MKEVQKTVLVPYEKYARCFNEIPTKDKEVQTEGDYRPESRRDGASNDARKIPDRKFPPGIPAHKKARRAEWIRL